MFFKDSIVLMYKDISGGTQVSYILNLYSSILPDSSISCSESSCSNNSQVQEN